MVADEHEKQLERMREAVDRKNETADKWNQ
jgi:hypothetical protein